MSLSSSTRLQIISHRGATTESIKENTIDAFQHAIDMQADMIETDVRQTKDGKLVCAHNPDWNGIMLKEITYENWKKNTEAKEGWRPPLLTEVLHLCEGVIPLNLELKEHGLEERVISRLPASYPIHDILFSSFEDEVIKKIKSMNETFQTALIVGKSLFSSSSKKFSYWKDFYPENRLKQAKADAICPHYRLANKSFVDRMHKHGYEVNVWTVNSAEKIKKIQGARVDGIFTDNVVLAQKQL
ncbi:glycerophosphodiester phosphodiesterase [Alteribacillus bidgolensis]|uniref:Glycerophosphoryl diester phosphodiesterase n=1 Tax=Alteribacillus bidgolensis TaxID=930129 RepID=A0A1G8EKU2_9BACI|nr:glycerophosphodiester phosphodiesterase [Alteribacillus bidgolensis]SDH70486.1 glycerophosphoryl diester phosphodiesterase [Alteribacillus bidgolensis]